MKIIPLTPNALRCLMAVLVLVPETTWQQLQVGDYLTQGSLPLES